MANRKRNIEVRFRVTQEELEMIHKKMAQYGTTNLSAFLRKMSIPSFFLTNRCTVLPDKRHPRSAS